jgi:OPA family phosphoglycerate-like MFS transporter
MSVAFLFLNGRQFRRPCWPAGSPTSCLKDGACRCHDLYGADFVCLIGYWKSESLLMVTVFAAIVGCLIYVPQFLASVQTMEIVPSFAVGSAVGLRGFMSYIFGASLGTSLFGVMVDKMGWHGGFYLLMGGIVCCILFCYLSHRGALELEQQRKNTAKSRLALADAQ